MGVPPDFWGLGIPADPGVPLDLGGLNELCEDLATCVGGSEILVDFPLEHETN